MKNINTINTIRNLSNISKVKRQNKGDHTVAITSTVAMVKVGDKVLSHGLRPVPLANPATVIRKTLLVATQYELSLQDAEGNIVVIFVESNRPVELEAPSLMTSVKRLIS